MRPLKRRNILDYDEGRYLPERERGAETQSLNSVRAKAEGGELRRGQRRNLKLFDATVVRLKISRLPLVSTRLRHHPRALCVFDARDDRNRGVWQGTENRQEKDGGRDEDAREKVYFTTDLLSRHARILSKLGEGDASVLSRFTRG